MTFFRRLLFNFVLMVILLAGVYFILPDIMGPIYKLYYSVLGPGLLLLLLVVTAMPGGRR